MSIFIFETAFSTINHVFLALQLETATSRGPKSCISSHAQMIGICRISRAKKIGRGKAALVSMHLVRRDITKLFPLLCQPQLQLRATNACIPSRRYHRWDRSIIYTTSFTTSFTLRRYAVRTSTHGPKVRERFPLGACYPISQGANL